MRSKFDIEECLTYIESQTREAEANHDDEKLQQLVDIEYLLIRLICEVLSEFNSLIPPFLQYEPAPPNLERFGNCVSFKKLGEILYHQKPIMISFNWDDFIERSIEHASGISSCYKDAQASPIHMGYGSWNWNRALGYGIQFDQLPDPSNHHKLYPNYLDGDRFYSRNSLYSWYLLKLHGSLNWFRSLPYTPNSILRDKKEDLKKLFEERRNKILLHDATWVPEFFSQGHPSLHNLYIHPLIITPILHKDKFLEDQLYSRLLKPLWKKAKDALSCCKKLVVIGYSFPPTDFMTKRLFLEAFSTNTLDELIVVNPQKAAVTKVKNLRHFKKPTRFTNLDEFVEYSRSSSSR